MLDGMTTTAAATRDQLELATLQVRAATYAQRDGHSSEAVRILEALTKTAELALQRAVAEMRADGHSWAAVAQVLGVTRQAAQQRFGLTDR